MSKSTTTAPVATAAVIRAAFQNGTLDVTKVVNEKGEQVNPISVLGRDGDASNIRGRVHPAFTEAFLAANPKAVIGKGSAPKMVEVPMFSTKTGRAIKPVLRPITEVRAAAGKAGKAGRLSSADMLKAAQVFGSGTPKAPKAATPAKPKAAKPAAAAKVTAPTEA